MSKIASLGIVVKLIFSKKIQLLISEKFAEKIIPKKDCARLPNEIIESPDLNRLYETFFKTGRKYATELAILLKVVVYAYMQGIYSSRNIESACKI